MPTLPTTVARAALALAWCAVLPGCLVHGSSSTVHTGQYIGPGTFGQIEPGRTKSEWVLATLGEPTSRSTLDDGSEVWKWTYSKTKSGHGSVFLLYGGSDRTQTDGAAFVQVRDGVVEKAWRD